MVAENVSSSQKGEHINFIKSNFLSDLVTLKNEIVKLFSFDLEGNN